MDLPVPTTHLNHLLRTLHPDTLASIQPMLEAVQLPRVLKLAEAGRKCRWMYFPVSGVASVIGRGTDNWQEIGVFGREGAGCLAPLLGSEVSTYSIIMQVPGEGFRIASADMLAATESCPELRELMLRYINAFMTQVAQSALANGQFNIGQRLARWILMIHDRVDGEAVALTHEFLAGMLGVGRTGVTLALHELERSGMISMGRKRINILDRSKLEALTSAFYGFAEAQYQRLIGTALSGSTRGRAMVEGVGSSLRDPLTS